MLDDLGRVQETGLCSGLDADSNSVVEYLNNFYLDEDKTIMKLKL